MKRINRGSQSLITRTHSQLSQVMDFSDSLHNQNLNQQSVHESQKHEGYNKQNFNSKVCASGSVEQSLPTEGLQQAGDDYVTLQDSEEFTIQDGHVGPNLLSSQTTNEQLFHENSM